MVRLLFLQLALTVAAATAQSPAPAGEPPVMVATPRHLFVLRDGVVYQFHVDTLELENTVRLPAVPARPGSDAAAAPRAPAPGVGAATAATAQAVQRALSWLRDHQDQDGRWDADGFMKHDRSGAPTDGAGNPVHDVAVTSLAVLAFLADGSTLRVGPHRAAVASAVSWLRDQQNANGLIGPSVSHDFVYGHAMATLALSEACGLSDEAALRKPVQRAVDYLESHRNPFMVWRYQPRDNDNDTSVTTWCLMATRSALDFGFDVNPAVPKLIATWFDQVTDPTTGRAGYTKRGERSSRHPGDHARRFPPARGEALTAAGLFARFLLGQDPEDNPVMRRAAETILQQPPRWSREDGTIDCYYWFFGGHAMYQMGDRYWNEWAKHLPAAVVDTQRRDGNFAGSWDPVGVWGEDGGRVYSTAMLTLALQSAHRYARVKGR